MTTINYFNISISNIEDSIFISDFTNIYHYNSNSNVLLVNDSIDIDELTKYFKNEESNILAVYKSFKEKRELLEFKRNIEKSKLLKCASIDIIHYIIYNNIDIKSKTKLNVTECMTNNVKKAISDGLLPCITDGSYRYLSKSIANEICTFMGEYISKKGCN